MKNSKRLYALLCAAALPIGGTLTACGKPSADPSTDGGTRYLPCEPEKGAVYAKATLRPRSRSRSPPIKTARAVTADARAAVFSS